jgi:hypothetical protein
MAKSFFLMPMKSTEVQRKDFLSSSGIILLANISKRRTIGELR